MKLDIYFCLDTMSEVHSQLRCTILHLPNILTLSTHPGTNILKNFERTVGCKEINALFCEA